MRKNKRGFRPQKRIIVGKGLEVITFEVITYIRFPKGERVIDRKNTRFFGNHKFYEWAKERGLARTNDSFWQYLQEKYDKFGGIKHSYSSGDGWYCARNHFVAQRID